MSGGVDSSVAAWLLKEQGYEVIGLFMKNWEDDDTDEYCTSREDLIDAVSVADRIGIDIEAVNFSAEYSERVFAQFPGGVSRRPHAQPGRAVQRRDQVQGLSRPRARPRRRLDRHRPLRAECAATSGEHSSCSRRRDATKDQSYFLYRLNQAQLSKTLFPLGDWLKRDVRDIARASSSCPTMPSATAPASASSASARSASS